MDLDTMLTTTEAAKMIGVDSKTLVRWANKNMINCHKTLGGHRRFRLEDVLKIVYGTGDLGKRLEYGKERVANG